VSTSLFDALGPLLSGRSRSQIASSLDIDEEKAASALQVAVPALVAALQRNASSADGLSGLTRALDRNHDGSVLDDVAGFLAGGGASDGDAILGHILGGRRDPLARSVGRSTGLDTGSVMKLLAMVAPLVLGALSRSRASRSGGSGSVSDVLADATANMQQRSPDLMSSLGSLLDANHDGSAADDLVRMAGSLSELFAKR
jgi:hypothetical protein